MRDLFSTDGRFETLRIPDADLSVLHRLETAEPYAAMLHRLTHETEWRQEYIRIYGKDVPQPRLTAWYGDPGTQYDYSGIRLAPLPWTQCLQTLKRQIEDCTGDRFNSVLLNLYRDHNDSVGYHSDDERKLGPEPVIASVSFGATRVFVLKHKSYKRQPLVKIPLESGSVLVMKGATQRCWKHAILKQSAPCGPRVNLTFRTIMGA